MLYRQGSRWALCPFKVRYMQHGQEFEQYTHDQQWWLDFAARWSHTEIIEFVDVDYTPEQLARFEDVEYMPEDFGTVYSEYVATGVFSDELPKNHPFNLIRLRRENQELGVEVSQREIDSIIQGQQLSDLEIRLIMGGL